MKEFFNVVDLETILEFRSEFLLNVTEQICIEKSVNRVLAEKIFSEVNLPDFGRSTMDGYAVCASSTFGASESNPAYLTVKGDVLMGKSPDFIIESGEAAGIPTGGMLPRGADSVLMIEHSEMIDDTTIEIYKSVAPGQHMIESGEDFKKGELLLDCGRKLRPQDMGLLAAFGKKTISVFKKPKIGIISTGDEIVPVDVKLNPGQIYDINSYTLSGMVTSAGGIPIIFGIVKDNYQELLQTCRNALELTDMLIVSGGSSVGSRDFTIDVLPELKEANILAHGISISPGKPTILAKIGNKAFWGLPGHVVSAMVVFEIVVSPFIEYVSGISDKYIRKFKVPAVLNRSIASAQGRTDFVRVRIIQNDGKLIAEPVLGKSGLINTMIKADGLIKIDTNTEGLDKGSRVSVMLLNK